MYIDGVIVFSLTVIVLTCAVVYVSARYAYKHVKQDMLAMQKQAEK